MNHREHTLKMIYHGIYKLDLYTLKLFKKDNNKKEESIPLFVDVSEKIEVEKIEVEKIEVGEEGIEIPENKILFRGENNLITSDMIKTIYNIDINNNEVSSFNIHTSFFYRSISYKIYDDKVIIYYI